MDDLEIVCIDSDNVAVYITADGRYIYCRGDEIVELSWEELVRLSEYTTIVI